MSSAVALELTKSRGPVAKASAAPHQLPQGALRPESSAPTTAFRRSLCCAGVLHCLTCGLLSAVYVKEFGVLLHRALFLSFWLRFGAPGWVAGMYLFIWLVDACMLPARVQDANSRDSGPRKYLVEAYIQALAPPLCLCGSTHYYLRDWSRAGLMTASLGGCGLWSIGDLFRLPGMVEAANAASQQALPLSFLARQACVQFWAPTVRSTLARWVTHGLDLKDSTERQALAPPSGSDPGGRLTDPPLDEEALPGELRVLSLCPTAGLLGCGHWYTGAPRMACVRTFTGSALGLGYLVDLCYSCSYHREQLEHVALRRRALAAGVPPPREPLRCHSLFVTWLVTGLVGAHHVVLGNMWLAVAYALSLGGCGTLYLSDAASLSSYVAWHAQAREREVLFTRAAEVAHACGETVLRVTPPLPSSLPPGAPTPAPQMLRLVGGNQHSLTAAYNKLHSQHTVPVSAFVAWACWLPFGGLLGLHHFYLGRYMHGLAAALTLNFFLMGWVADGCLMGYYLQDAAAQAEGGGGATQRLAVPVPVHSFSPVPSETPAPYAASAPRHPAPPPLAVAHLEDAPPPPPRYNMQPLPPPMAEDLVLHDVLRMPAPTYTLEGPNLGGGEEEEGGGGSPTSTVLPPPIPSGVQVPRSLSRSLSSHIPTTLVRQNSAPVTGSRSPNTHTLPRVGW